MVWNILDIAGEAVVAVIMLCVTNKQFTHVLTGVSFLFHSFHIKIHVHSGKLKRIPFSVKSHSLLSEQLGYQLRNRVLQELDLLADRLRCTPSKSRETIVVRKLTRSEWNDIKSSGWLSHPGAVAILIVPPVQKKTLLCAQEPQDFQQSRICQIYPNVLIPNSSSTGSQALLSPNMIPVYDGAALFPSPRLRHELRQRLQILLTVERKARWQQKKAIFQEPSIIKDQDSKLKSSHAYIIFADHDTAQRSDSVPLVIALWRLRLWEGFGWDASKGDYGGWYGN